MKCSENLANLAAYLHDELTSTDEDSFQLHLSVCHACREKHTSARDVLLRLQRVVPLEPSAGAREDLHRTIGTALRKSIQQSPGRSRDGNDSRWRRPFSARPFALPLKRPPALPPPAMPEAAALPPPSPAPESTAPTQPKTQPEPSAAPNGSANLPASTASAVPAKGGSSAALSPTARAVSARLDSITRRRQRARVRMGFLIAFFVAGIGGLYGAWWLNHRPAHVAVAAPKISPAERLARQRWNERHIAIGKQLPSETLLINKQADLSGVVDEKPVCVLAHFDPRSGESCLVLYKDEDTKAIALDEHFDAANFKQLLAQGFEVIPMNGVLSMPERAVDLCIGPDNRVVILKLENRTEIWSLTHLNSYITNGPVFDTSINSPAPVNGLPTLKTAP